MMVSRHVWFAVAFSALAIQEGKSVGGNQHTNEAITSTTTEFSLNSDSTSLGLWAENSTTDFSAEIANMQNKDSFGSRNFFDPGDNEVSKMEYFTDADVGTEELTNTRPFDETPTQNFLSTKLGKAFIATTVIAGTTLIIALPIVLQNIDDNTTNTTIPFNSTNYNSTDYNTTLPFNSTNYNNTTLTVLGQTEETTQAFLSTLFRNVTESLVTTAENFFSSTTDPVSNTSNGSSKTSADLSTMVSNASDNITTPIMDTLTSPSTKLITNYTDGTSTTDPPTYSFLSTLTSKLSSAFSDTNGTASATVADATINSSAVDSINSTDVPIITSETTSFVNVTNSNGISNNP